MIGKQQEGNKGYTTTFVQLAWSPERVKDEKKEEEGNGMEREEGRKEELKGEEVPGQRLT